MAARPSRPTHADIEEAALGVAQHQHAEHGDADAGRCAPRCRSGSAGRRRSSARRTACTRQSGGKIVPKRASQRISGMMRDGDGRDGAAFVEAAIVVDHQVERRRSRRRRQRLDPADDDDRRGRQDHEQQQRLDPQPGAQGERQEDGEDQRLPHPVPLVAGLDREVGMSGGAAGIGEQQRGSATGAARPGCRCLSSAISQPASASAATISEIGMLLSR